MPIANAWDLNAFEIRQWGSSAHAAAKGQLNVRASLTNRAGFAQPLPLLRLEIEDRFGDAVAIRDFEPGEYLKDPVAELTHARGRRGGRGRARHRRADRRRRGLSPQRLHARFGPECPAAQRHRAENVRACRIGPYRLTGRALLAPMAGVTDLPFRRLCRRLGAALAAGEMLSSDARLWDTDESRRRRDHTDEPEPRVVQIAGGDRGLDGRRRAPPASMPGADHRHQHGVPGEEGLQQGRGLCVVARRAASQATVADRAVAAVPVSRLKMRTGWDVANRNGVRIAKLAESLGVRALAVHGRTRACRFEGARRIRDDRGNRSGPSRFPSSRTETSTRRRKRSRS